MHGLTGQKKKKNKIKATEDRHKGAQANPVFSMPPSCTLYKEADHLSFSSNFFSSFFSLPFLFIPHRSSSHSPSPSSLPSLCSFTPIIILRVLTSIAYHSSILLPLNYPLFLTLDSTKGSSATRSRYPVH